MTELESVYVTDREELRKRIIGLLTYGWMGTSQAARAADALMPIVDSLLEWGNGLAKQAADEADEASREAVERVIDEHCCSADVTGAIVAKLFKVFHLYPRNPSRLSQAEIDDARRDASQPVEDRGLYREDS